MTGRENTVRAARLDAIEALDLAWDARVVAIRWDLVPWRLVLDLDTPISEGKGAPMKRAWLVFEGVSEVSIPMLATRLPTGIWLTSSFSAEDVDEGFRVYSCRALLPTFEGNQLMGASGAVSVRAKNLTGLASTDSCTPDEYGLSWDARTALASDLDMLASLKGS